MVHSSTCTIRSHSIRTLAFIPILETPRTSTEPNLSECLALVPNTIGSPSFSLSFSLHDELYTDWRGSSGTTLSPAGDSPLGEHKLEDDTARIVTTRAVSLSVHSVLSTVPDGDASQRVHWAFHSKAVSRWFSFFYIFYARSRMSKHNWPCQFKLFNFSRQIGRLTILEVLLQNYFDRI